MKISEYIDAKLKEQGRSKRWLGEKLGLNDNTLYSKFARDTFDAYEIIKISIEMNLDLNVLKESVIF